MFPGHSLIPESYCQREVQLFHRGTFEAAGKLPAFFRGKIGDVCSRKYFEAVDGIDDQHGDGGTDNVPAFRGIVIGMTRALEINVPSLLISENIYYCHVRYRTVPSAV